MSNDAIHTAISLRVGALICLPHTRSLCGKPANKFGHHGLSCRPSQRRASCHQMLNNVIYNSLTSANISSLVEPSGLYKADGKLGWGWWDGVILVPWSNGRFLVCDATCVDTLWPFSHAPVNRFSAFTGATYPVLKPVYIALTHFQTRIKNPLRSRI